MIQKGLFQDYLTLCKPRVVLLMLLTVLVGMYLAPATVKPELVFYTLIGIGLCASSAAAINHTLDKHIDALMARTKNRPVAHGRLSSPKALLFASLMGISGLIILTFYVNPLTALLTFITLIGYAGLYTGFLKRATPQNIVIGGLAGAAPPLLGWTAVTHQLDPQALLLVLIIFTWTPPHFWALAIYRLDEYAAAEIPMLPVTHGVSYTKLNIVLYTILLCVVTLLPYLVGMCGVLYLVSACLLNARFMYWAVKLYRHQKPRIAMQTFRYSITYLLLLFIILLADHHLQRLSW